MSKSVINFKPIVTKCHIRALTFEKPFLFVGIGSTLHVFKTGDNGLKALISSKPIFTSFVITGVNTYLNSQTDSHIEIIVAISGNRFLSLYKFLYILSTNVYTFDDLLVGHNFYDWLLSIRLTHSLAFVVKAHNEVIVYDWQQNVIINTISGEDKCLLYSAELLYISEEPKGFVLASGTVFKQIVIWNWFQTQVDNSFKTQIQQRLEGHDGVIFALNYNKSLNILVSASDDRSVRIWTANSELGSESVGFWERNRFSLNQVFYGHLSRIWNVITITKPRPIVISVGEDGGQYFWDLTAKKLIQRVNGHRNSSIWSLAVDNESMISFSGGSDASIICCDIQNTITAFDPLIMSNIHPKQLVFIGQQELLYIFCVTISGDIYLLPTNTDSKSIKNSDYNYMLNTYCALDVNIKRNQIVLGSKFGDIAVVTIKMNLDNPLDICVKRVYTSKVLSVCFVDCNHFVSCGLNGVVKVMSVNTMTTISEYVLPNSRHRWPVDGLIYEKLLILGDRCGSVFVYKINEEKPFKEFRHLHGSNGVTAIKLKPKSKFMYSSGRNGKICEFLLEDQNCILLRAYRIFSDMEWIGNFTFDDTTNQLSYVYGFESRNFVIWDEIQQRFIESVDCGGGHRSWDYINHQNQHNLCYTKHENLLCYRKKLSKINVNSNIILNKTFHTKKINCCHILFTTSLNTYISIAGEDNIIHIGNYNHRSKLIKLETQLFGHISNICAITGCLSHKSSDSCFMVSVGGRTQLILWSIQLKDNQLFCKQLFNKFLWDSDIIQNRTKKINNLSLISNPQIRYLDANISKINDNKYLITTACSDSSFRLFIFDSTLMIFYLLNTTSYNTSCVLRVLTVNQSHVITTSNDGTLRLWFLGSGFTGQMISSDNDFQSKQIDLKSVFEMRLHESGINALFVYSLNDELFIIVTGGDDNTLVLSLFSILSDDIILISSVNDKYTHLSQITGIKIVSDCQLLSASIDQRIIIWKYSSNVYSKSLSLEPICFIISSIADISSIVAFFSDVNEWHVMVCGEGFELLDDECVDLLLMELLFPKVIDV
ncbi:WD repeat-containing protein 6-like [Oppia nitens]|uniref:WD repeat-containing protein 6-like n=1 Tax=Oppia nitens TaxID=1686743 RepID=UPI0023DC80F9|nr:WD repeat-containing protein 6-like [Oppia nitens]